MMRERDRGRAEVKNFVGDVQTKEKRQEGQYDGQKRQLSKRKEEEVDGQGQKDLG